MRALTFRFPDLFIQFFIPLNEGLVRKRRRFLRSASILPAAARLSFDLVLAARGLEEFAAHRSVSLRLASE